MLANQASNYLATGKVPQRLGNHHPNIVPYQVVPASDGFFILAVGNDPTFERFVQVCQRAAPDAGAEKLLQDERFNAAAARTANRKLVTETCNAITKQRSVDWWLTELEAASIGCSKIQSLEEVFQDPHVLSRDMVIEMPVEGLDKPAKLVGSPYKFSRTAVSYRRSPPQLGQHTEELLTDIAGYESGEVEALRKKGIV